MLRRVLASIGLFAALVQAAVTRVEVADKVDVGAYERIAGKVYFAVDPRLPANRAIVDIELAPRNAAGMVEFSADLLILRPTVTFLSRLARQLGSRWLHQLEPGE